MSNAQGIAPMGKQFVTHPPQVLARIQRLCDFHEMTKVSPPDDSSLQLDQKPAFFRVFPDCPKIPLPTKLLDAPTGVLKVMSMGRAALPESMACPPQNLQTLTSWIHMAAGITGKLSLSGQSHFLRSYPSAGSLYPTEVYVLALGISDLEPGLYHFSGKEFCLRKLRDGWEALAQLKRGRPDLEVLKTMPAVILLSSIFWRSAWKYGNRAFRYAAIDAGHVAENLVLCGAGLGIQTMVRMHINDRNTRELIGVQKDCSFDNYEVVQGFVAWADKATKPIESPQTRPAPATLKPIARERLSPSCEEYPAIRTAHEDCVAPGVGINELRPPYTERCPLPSGANLVQLSHEDVPNDLALIQAVKRRRSTRVFTESGISRDHFGKLNRVAFGGGTYYPLLPDGHHMGLIRAYWFVHNVTGVTAGLWYYHANCDKFVSLRYGDLRFDCKYLCNNQDYCSTASAVCMMVADVREGMNASSPDTYRLAHMESGIAGQRLYLACTAMSIDCCSVGTFQDDDLRQALELANTDWQCIYGFAVGSVRRPSQPDVVVSPDSGGGMRLR